MKILLFIETGGPGGAERVTVDLASGLKKRGHDPGVLTLRTGWLSETLAAENIRHHQIISTRSPDLTLPFRIARLIRQERYDVLHSHLLDSNFYGALAARIAGCTHVATEHGDIHHISKKRFARTKLWTLARLGTQLTAVSHFSRLRLLELGIKAERVQVIGNPMTAEASPAETRVRVRAELGIDEHCWVWAHVANLRPVKDQKTLIKGFAEALQHSEKAQQLLIIGDGAERPALEALVKQHGIETNVQFLGFRNDVHNLLSSADAFVLTSKSEAMPMSLLEAATQGLVLIGSEVGGIPEVLQDGATGFLFPPEDASALSRVMLKILNDRQAAKETADRAQNDIKARFSIDAVLDAYLKLYR